MQTTRLSMPLTHFYMRAGYVPVMDADIIRRGGRLGFNLTLHCLHLTERGNASPVRSKRWRHTTTASRRYRWPSEMLYSMVLGTQPMLVPGCADNRRRLYSLWCR